MKIVLAADHGGYLLKNSLMEALAAEGHELINLGVDNPDSVDYPDQAAQLCAHVLQEGDDFGILCCGTGIGMSIAANKVPGIRCAHLADAYSAAKAREHNNANVIALGGRTLGPDLALDLVHAFMGASFAGGRHQRRLDKISALEKEARR